MQGLRSEAELGGELETYLEGEYLVNLLICECLGHAAGVVLLIPDVLRARPVVRDVLVPQPEGYLLKERATTIS